MYKSFLNFIMKNTVLVFQRSNNNHKIEKKTEIHKDREKPWFVDLIKSHLVIKYNYNNTSLLLIGNLSITFLSCIYLKEWEFTACIV